MKKRVLSVLIAVTLIFSLSAVVFTGNAAAANDTEKLSMAKALYSINLFKGYDTTGTNFGLTDVPTREQALVFQIRVLGEETAALAWKGSSPYTDVPAGNGYLPYIGYATDKGYTKGIGGGKFGFEQPAEAKMLTTFVLRGMGYSDSGTTADFTYDKSIDYGRNLGICDSDITTAKFTRGDAVSILYRALGTGTKGSGTLASKLIAKGQFTQTQYEAAQKIAGGGSSSTGLPSTLVELKTGNTHGNANNFGLAVSDGSYIYYTVPASKRIDRMNLDGTNVVTLTKANAQALNIMNGWLYYADNTNKSIAKISLDGTSQSTVKSGAWPVYMQVADNGWIYFINRSDGNKLCCVKIDGTGYDTVTEIACGEFYLFKDYIVVEAADDGNKLYWINANDFTQYGKITELSCDSSTYYNGKFYFANGSDGRKYYSINPDGTGLSKLRDWYTGSAVIAGSKLYFCGGGSSRTNCKLYVQSISTGAEPKLLSGSNLAYNLSVVGSYAFYTKYDAAFNAKTGSISAPMRIVKIDGTGDKAAPTPSGMIGEKVDPTSVSLDKTTLSLAVGEKYDLTAKLAPVNSKISLTWSSSAPTVASVGSSGVVTGLKAGTSTITVKTHNGKTATCKVTVTAAVSTIKGDFDIVNLTGKRITELYMTTSNTTDWGTNLVSGGYIENNYTVPFEISFSKSTKYDIMVKYSDGTTGDFRDLSFANATKDGGTIVLKGSTVTLYPLITVPVTFVNMTGKSFTAMYASSSLIDDWGSSLLSGSLANNGSVKINFPMTAYDTKFDMLANYSGGSYQFTEMDFGTLPTSGATLYLYVENNVPKISATKPVEAEETRNITVTFNNKTGKSITDFRASSSQLSDWGDKLISATVADNGSFQVIFPVSKSDSVFDFRLMIDEAQYDITGIDFSAVTGSITCSFAFDGSSLGLYQN